jgi:hypothetical protein
MRSMTTRLLCVPGTERRQKIECLGAGCFRSVDCRYDLLRSADSESRERNAARPCPLFECLNVERRGDSRIGDRTYPPRAGHSFDQNVLPLAVELRREQADSGDVSAGARKRGDQPRRDHVFDDTDERHGARESLKRAQGELGTRYNRIGRSVDQSSRLLCQMFVDSLEPPGKDNKVLSFDKAVEPQFVEQCEHAGRLPPGRAQEPEAIGPTGFLRARRKRPRDGRAAE